MGAFEIGLKAIDDDHRHMLSIMREIKAEAEQRNRESCVALLEELLAFSRSHFDREEKLLQEMEYPSADRHAQYHENLLERAKQVKQACVDIRSDNDFRNCCDEMFSFLIEDVIAGDLKIKSFLEYNGLTDTKP
jgi:hemerythrin